MPAVRKKNYPSAILLFFITALLIRSAFLACNYSTLTQTPTATDSFGYFERAVNLTQYHTYTFPEKDNEVAFWTPGYPFFMFVLFKIAGIKIGVVLIVQMLIGSGTLTLLYLLIKQNINQSWDKYIRIFLLLVPDFILYDFQLLTQCLFNAFLLIVFYLLQTAKWKNYKYAILTGFALGYAILIKSVATFVIPLFLFYLFFYERKYWKQGLFLVVVAILSVLPWSVRNYTFLGKFVWVHTNTQWNFYLGNHVQSTGAYGGKTSYLYDHTFLEGYNELEREKICKARAWEFIQKHPFQMIENNLLKLSRTFSPRGAWALYHIGNSKTGVDFSAYNIIPNTTFIQWYSLPFLFIIQVFGIIGILTALQNIRKHYWIIIPYLAFLSTFFFFVTGTNYVYLTLPCLVYLAALGFTHYNKLILVSVSAILILLNWIFQYFLHTN
jgi:hypothetical protein